MKSSEFQAPKVMSVGRARWYTGRIEGPWNAHNRNAPSNVRLGVHGCSHCGQVQGTGMTEGFRTP
jgi:hypothetical protein